MIRQAKAAMLGSILGFIGALFVVTPVLAQAEMEINLGPRLIFTPNEFQFSKDKYVFRDNPPRLDPNGTISGTQVVGIEKIDQDGNVGGDPRGEYYKIKVSNIEKKRFGYQPFRETKSLFATLIPAIERARAYAPPPATNIFVFRRPYPFRLTFVQPVSADNFNSLAAYLTERGNKDNVFFGSSECLNNDQRAFMCFKETVKVTNADTSEITLTLSQKVEVDGTYIQGNIAALQQIANIRLAPNAIAVGGTFSNVQGTLLTRYLQDNPTSLIGWSKVESKLVELYNKRTLGTGLPRNAFAGTWYLNTQANTPSNFEPPTTFSSPPEGRLWYFLEPVNTLQFSDITFDGSGTLVIPGNAVFTKPIKCTPGSRVGVIASGNIEFRDTHIECGAYVALGTTGDGNITFSGEPPAGGDTAVGIFVAKNNITIPEAANSPYFIDYDAKFAQQPTVLFKELLTILLIALS